MTVTTTEETTAAPAADEAPRRPPPARRAGRRRPAGRGRVHRRDVRRLLGRHPAPAGPVPMPPATPPPTGAPFDPSRPWALHPQVALRPESFGALAYHFGTRRLSFLKSRTLLAVVESLADQPSGRAACLAAGVPAEELGAYERALAALAESGHDLRAGGMTAVVPPARDPPGRPVRAGPRRPDLPHLGAHLRLQPGLRPLPVEFGPARPRRADDRGVQGAHRRVRADADLLREHRRRRADHPIRLLGAGRLRHRPPRRGQVLDQRIPDHRGGGGPAGGERLRRRPDLARRGHAEVNDAVRGAGSLRHRAGRHGAPGRRPVSPASSSRWWSPGTTSASSTRSRRSPTATAPSSASPGCARRAGAPTCGTSSTRPPTSSASSTTGWSAHGEDVLTGDSFFHLAGYGDALPGPQPVRRRPGGVPGRPGGRRLRLPVRHPRRVPGRQRPRRRRLHRGVARRPTCSPSSARPRARAPARRAATTTPAGAAAWRPSSSPGSPSTAPTPSASSATASTPLGARRPRDAPALARPLGPPPAGCRSP